MNSNPVYFQIHVFLRGLRLDFLASQSSHVKHAIFLLNHVPPLFFSFFFILCYVFLFSFDISKIGYENSVFNCFPSFFFFCA